MRFMVLDWRLNRSVLLGRGWFLVGDDLSPCWSARVGRCVFQRVTICDEFSGGDFKAFQFVTLCVDGVWDMVLILNGREAEHAEAEGLGGADAGVGGGEEGGGIGDLQEAYELGGAVESGVALAVCGAFFDENLAGTRDGLERGGSGEEAVLGAFSREPFQQIFALGDGDALGIPALALGIARGGELAGGIDEE